MKTLDELWYGNISPFEQCTRGDTRLKEEWHGMRHHDKRPPLRGAVHTESERQTHLQECLCKDTRGMRRKARRADQNHESGNRGDEKGGECVNVRGATMNGRPSIFEMR